MEELERRKEIFKIIHCFKGPIHQAFVYVYYQLYTQDTNVYQYLINTSKDSLFLPKELEFLKTEHRPAELRFSLLYKVLKFCCSPPLAQPDSALWSSSDIIERCSIDYKVEEILVSFVNTYKRFLRDAHKLSVEEINQLIGNLNHNVSVLIEKTADFTGSTRWPEEMDCLRDMFARIKKGTQYSSKKSISDLVKAEAEFRADLYDEVLKDELENLDGSTWHLEIFACDDKGSMVTEEYEAKERVDVESVFKVLTEREKRVCWLAGEHGVGKSSLAAYFASSWNSQDGQVKDVDKFHTVIVVSLSEMLTMNYANDDLFSYFLPLSSLLLSKDLLENWLEKEKVLIIFDDVNKHCEKIIEAAFKKVAATPNLMVWFMGRVSSLLKYTMKTTYRANALLLELKGLKSETVLRLTENLKGRDTEVTLKTKLQPNMSRLRPIMKYPTITQWTCQIWKENPGLFRNIYSASDLMWEILAWRVRQSLKINIKKIGQMRKKFLTWLMVAGELALYCLKADLRMEKESIGELENEISKVFKENGRKILPVFFKPVILHSFTNCLSTIASTSKPFLEYLASWFFIEELINDKRLCDLTEGLVNQLPLILFSAGHLERFQELGSISVTEERRAIRALITYRKDSYDDFSFIQKFVAELKCIKRLVQIVIDETEYNEEWNINFSSVQQKSLEVLLNHVSPTRLIFFADNSQSNYELAAVMNYVCRVDISVWLDSVPQFNYGNKSRLDKLLKPFLGDYVIPKVDLISGSLSSSIIKDLCKAKATQHLVLLKVKVNDEKNLNAALSVPRKLPHLLWLEVKLDMDVSTVQVSNIRPTQVELFDVHIRGVEDHDSAHIADLLISMHNRYTGIHLEETSMTPEGVFTLLQQLSKKGIKLCGREESINKFRRWYYPALSSIPQDENLTEEQYIQLIGHDDRKFFSDHRVNSSRFVTSINAWNLRSYLEDEKSVVYFVYEANNIIFSKELNGEVSIAFKGDYKENIRDKVINGMDDKAKSIEIEKHIMEFY